MRFLLLFIVSLLSGCSLFCKKEIVYEPVEVKVPVPVRCTVEVPAKPVWQMDYPDVRKANVFVKGNSALVELEQRRQYEREWEAALQACVSQ